MADIIPIYISGKISIDITSVGLVQLIFTNLVESADSEHMVMVLR